MRSLIYDIDKDVLNEMRAQGMSNHEIAIRVGVCDATIYRILGRQGKRMRTRSDCKSNRPAQIVEQVELAPVEETEAVKNAVIDETEEKPVETKTHDEEPCLLVESSLINLTGDVASYCIQTNENTLTISAGCDCNIEVPFHRIGIFINELKAIERNLDKIKNLDFIW